MLRLQTKKYFIFVTIACDQHHQTWWITHYSISVFHRWKSCSWLLALLLCCSHPALMHTRVAGLTGKYVCVCVCVCVRASVPPVFLSPWRPPNNIDCGHLRPYPLYKFSEIEYNPFKYHLAICFVVLVAKLLMFVCFGLASRANCTITSVHAYSSTFIETLMSVTAPF